MRTYKRKSNQTRPEESGVKNMPEDFVDKHKAEGNGAVLAGLIPLFKKAQERRGTNWSEETLLEAVIDFFDYCNEHEVKVYKGGLILWLGCSRQQYWDWENNPAKYGVISDIINQANRTIEGQYIGRAEQYPTANLFLLRTSHGHVETSRLDVKQESNSTATPDQINDMVSKLGLDKPKGE